jgi:hypothetical protein
MKKFVITEDEKNHISKMYGLINEQNTNSVECKKQKTAQEVFDKVRKEGKDFYFACIDIPQMFANKIKSVPRQEGVFKYNKSSNILELYVGDVGMWTMFTGNFFGDKIGNIKMSPSFASKVPEIDVTDNDIPYWVIESGKLCLFVGGFC